MHQMRIRIIYNISNQNHSGYLAISKNKKGGDARVLMKNLQENKMRVCDLIFFKTQNCSWKIF